MVSSAAGGDGKKSGPGGGSTDANVVGGVGSQAGVVEEVYSKRVVSVVVGGSRVGLGSGKNLRMKRSAAAGSIKEFQRSLLETSMARVAAETRAASGVRGTSVRERYVVLGKFHWERWNPVRSGEGSSGGVRALGGRGEDVKIRETGGSTGES